MSSYWTNHGAYDAVTHRDSVFQTVPLANGVVFIKPLYNMSSRSLKGNSFLYFCEEQYVQENNKVAIKRTCCVY